MVEFASKVDLEQDGRMEEDAYKLESQVPADRVWATRVRRIKANELTCKERDSEVYGKPWY